MNPLDKPGTVFAITLANPRTTKGTKDGAPVFRVSFEIDLEDWLQFTTADTRGMVLAMKGCVADTGEALESDLSDSDTQPATTVPKTKESRPYGKLARELRLSGWCRTPDVWRALGSDAEYLEWLRDQKCAACGLPSLPPHRNQAAHVRRVGDGAGMGIKPSNYSAITLCHACHKEQHDKGEETFKGREWFDKERIKAVEKWAWERLKVPFDAESMGDVPPVDVAVWADANDLLRYLPMSYAGYLEK